jgi:hypothetical protein
VNLFGQRMAASGSVLDVIAPQREWPVAGRIGGGGTGQPGGLDTASAVGYRCRRAEIAFRCVPLDSPAYQAVVASVPG